MKRGWKWNTEYAFFYGSIIVGGLMLLLGACSRPQPYDWGGLARGLEQVKSGQKQ